jgi:hypothetical protein
VPVGSRIFSCPRRRDRLWGPPNLLSNGYLGLSSGVKRPGRETDHSPPASAEVKQMRIYTSTRHIRVHGVVLNWLSTGTYNAKKWQKTCISTLQLLSSTLTETMGCELAAFSQFSDWVRCVPPGFHLSAVTTFKPDLGNIRPIQWLKRHFLGLSNG